METKTFVISARSPRAIKKQSKILLESDFLFFFSLEFKVYIK